MTISMFDEHGIDFLVHEMGTVIGIPTGGPSEHRRYVVFVHIDDLSPSMLLIGFCPDKTREVVDIKGDVKGSRDGTGRCDRPNPIHTSHGNRAEGGEVL